MRYVLLLRGINVGGKNKVVMGELKQQLQSAGFTRVLSYINSGNLIFDSPKEAAEVKAAIQQLFEKAYAFAIRFALIRAKDYQNAVGSLPDWWYSGGFARRDALFFTDGVTMALAKDRIGRMKLHDEIVHFTEIGLFWGKIHEKEYLKTAYHKQLAAEDLYKKVTIRNGNTVDQILALVAGSN